MSEQTDRQRRIEENFAAIRADIAASKASCAEAREHLAAMRQHTANAASILDEVSASLDRITEQRNANTGEFVAAMQARDPGELEQLRHEAWCRDDVCPTCDGTGDCHQMGCQR